MMKCVQEVSFYANSKIPAQNILLVKKGLKLKKLCFNKGIHDKVAVLFIARNDSPSSCQYILLIAALVLKLLHEEWHLSISSTCREDRIQIQVRGCSCLVQTAIWTCLGKDCLCLGRNKIKQNYNSIKYYGFHQSN